MERYENKGVEVACLHIVTGEQERERTEGAGEGADECGDRENIGKGSMEYS